MNITKDLTVSKCFINPNIEVCIGAETMEVLRNGNHIISVPSTTLHMNIKVDGKEIYQTDTGIPKHKLNKMSIEEQSKLLLMTTSLASAVISSGSMNLSNVITCLLSDQSLTAIRTSVPMGYLYFDDVSSTFKYHNIQKNKNYPFEFRQKDIDASDWVIIREANK